MVLLFLQADMSNHLAALRLDHIVKLKTPGQSEMLKRRNDKQKKNHEINDTSKKWFLSTIYKVMSLTGTNIQSHKNVLHNDVLTR